MARSIKDGHGWLESAEAADSALTTADSALVDSKIHTNIARIDQLRITL